MYPLQKKLRAHFDLPFPFVKDWNGIEGCNGNTVLQNDISIEMLTEYFERWGLQVTVYDEHD